MRKKFLFGLVLIILAGLAWLYFVNFSRSKVNWGITFSPYYAQSELGLNWQETYLAILDDLKVDHLRLSAYWSAIEAEKGSYNFDDLDWQVNQATNRDVKIVMAVGRRLPRWPECHDPGWLKNLDQLQVQARQLAMIETVVNRYKNNPNIISWQVENEPFLEYFGECPKLDVDFYKKEISLVKELTNKPIIVTDSGELSTWLPVAQTGGDILGTTLYRVVYNKWFGYFKWFLPSSFYTVKAWVVRKLSPISNVIVMELQGEAWHIEGKNLMQMANEDKFKSLSIEQFKSNIAYAKQAGFTDVYLWGAEWWYYMKTQRDFPGYWDEAKQLWE